MNGLSHHHTRNIRFLFLVFLFLSRSISPAKDRHSYLIEEKQSPKIKWGAHTLVISQI